MATTRLVLAVLAFVSLFQGLLADDPQCLAAEIGTLKCDTTCSIVGLCIAAGTGFNAWVPLDACSYGTVCTDNTGQAQCTEAPAPTCRSNPNPVPTDIVTCMAAGKYPSYESCYYYYDCSKVGDIAYPVSCPVGYVFDSCSATCVAGVCTPGDAVYCEDGQVGVDSKNNRNYYYCFGNRRYWFTCGAGFAYAVVGKMCVKTTLTNGCLACYDKTGNMAFGGQETCHYLYCKGTGNIQVNSCQPGYRYGSVSNPCTSGTCFSTFG